MPTRHRVHACNYSFLIISLTSETELAVSKECSRLVQYNNKLKILKSKKLFKFKLGTSKVMLLGCYRHDHGFYVNILISWKNWNQVIKKRINFNSNLVLAG